MGNVARASHDGATAVEYSIMLAAVAAVIVAVVVIVGTQTCEMVETTDTAMQQLRPHATQTC